MRTLVTLLALAGTALAQPQPQQTLFEQQIKAQLGELMFTNSVLISQVRTLTEENTRLKIEIERLKSEGKQEGK